MSSDNDDKTKPKEPTEPVLDFGAGNGEPLVSDAPTTEAPAPTAEPEGGTQHLEPGEPAYEPTVAKSGIRGRVSQFFDSTRERTRSMVNKFAGRRAFEDAPKSPDGDPPTQALTLHGAGQGTGFTSRFKRTGEGLKSALHSGWDPAAVAGWATTFASSIQKGGASFYLKAATVLTCAFVYADLAALLLSRYIPEPPPSRGFRAGGASRHVPSAEDYAAIQGRNLFSSKNLLPGEETPGGPQDPGGPPTKTTLPFTLVGTIILQDELRSIGTIEDKSASMVYPVRVDDEIPQKARILKVEARKVIFLNTASNRREYVDLPEEMSAVNPRITLGAPSGGGGGGIEQLSPNQFFVNRGEVDRALADLNNILTQARAVPNFENGLPAGYKLFQIVPGSIYDKLGLRNGDVIAGMDGQPVNDPGKAFEALGRLKETNHLELSIKRDGKTSNFSYDIR